MSFLVFVVVGVQQTVQMHDEVAHMRIVYRCLGLAPPGPASLGVVRVEAHDIQSLEVDEFGPVRV